MTRQQPILTLTIFPYKIPDSPVEYSLQYRIKSPPKQSIMQITFQGCSWLLIARGVQALCGVILIGITGSRMSGLQGFSDINVNGL